MKRKILITGLTSFLATANLAHAADAVVVEPEPLNFVRVCDAYGSGFFFIPGTETCIRFSGYVRSAYEKAYIDLEADENGVTSETSLTFWGQRARLNIDTRNETDWGTLRAVYRLEGGDSNIDTDIDMDVALISLAGFRFGFAGSNYWNSNHSDGGVKFEGQGDTLPIAEDEGFTGFDDATLIDYTYAQGGFSLTIGAEDPRIGESELGFIEGTFNGGPGAAGILGTSTGSALIPDIFEGIAAAHVEAVAVGNLALNPALISTPAENAAALAIASQSSSDTRANFYVGFNYEADFGELAFTAVHDATALDSTALAFGQVDQGGFAYKVSLSLDLSEFIPGGLLYGAYSYDGDYITNYVHTEGSGIDDAEQIWQVSYMMDLTDELEFNTQYSEARGSEWGELIRGQREEARVFSVGLNWFPQAAPGFSIRGSFTTGEVENPVNLIINDFDQIAGSGFDFDAFAVTVRRDF